MHPVKIIWGVRANVYKLLFKKVGHLSYIGKPLFIEGYRNIQIGNRVRIFPGIRMEAMNAGTIEIGNDVVINQNVHITADEFPVIIGSGTAIVANVYITNIDHEYEDVNRGVIKQGHKNKRTVIGEDCFIGFGAGIQAGTVLGKHCIVGSNAIVRGEFPDYCVLAGVPARIVKIYDAELDKWVKYSDKTKGDKENGRYNSNNIDKE